MLLRSLSARPLVAFYSGSTRRIASSTTCSVCPNSGDASRAASWSTSSDVLNGWSGAVVSSCVRSCTPASASLINKSGGMRSPDLPALRCLPVIKSFLFQFLVVLVFYFKTLVVLEFYYDLCNFFNYTFICSWLLRTFLENI